MAGPKTEPKITTSIQLSNGLRSLAALPLALLIALPLQARVVNSVEDRERLLGWGAHQKFKHRVEEERLADVGEVERARRQFEEAQSKDLVEYRKWKATQKAALDESSEEYKKDLQMKVDIFLAEEKRRESYVKERQVQRRLAQSEVSLTEETELGLDEKRPRVDWESRNLLADKSKISGKANGLPSIPSFNRNSDSGRSDYIPPEFDAPPPPPPAEFFEPDIPPPPGGDGFDAPSPPPFNEGAPPPIFDDDF